MKKLPENLSSEETSATVLLDGRSTTELQVSLRIPSGTRTHDILFNEVTDN